MKFNIVANFVFLEIEAENETWALEYVDEAFTNYIFHPQTNEKVFALYDVEAVEHTRALDSALCAACNEPESNHTLRTHAFISRTPSQ